MSLISNINASEDIKDVVESDVTGGTYLVDSGLYDMVIDMAYLTQSRSSKAIALVLKLKGRDGVMLNETIYFTNRNGDIHYIKEGEKIALPGYAQLNSLAHVVENKGFMEVLQSAQEKQVMVYDWDEKKDVAQTKEVVMDLINKKVKVGVLRQYEDIGDSNNNYAPSGFSREANKFDKFFDIDSGKTFGEISAGKEATYIDKWLARNENITRDMTKNKIGLKPKPKDAQPAPGGATGGNAPAATAAAPESLFGDDKPEDDDVPF